MSLRVVSLVPSVTETLLAWGITPVAVTRFCEHPELHQVGGTKDPDVGAIVALAPDLVVMCDEENRIEDAEALTAAGVALHVVRIRSVGDVAPQLDALAARLGVVPPATLSSSRLLEPSHASSRRVEAAIRAFVPIWRDARPGRTPSFRTLNGHTYGSSLLAAAGVANVFADAADRYPPTTLEEVAALGVDRVLAPSEPYPFSERHRAELSRVAPVTFLDGQDLFWWGVRTAAAAQRLIRALHGASAGPS